jgi:hypothetical protein
LASAHAVRVRITRQPTGSVDGVPLPNYLVVGVVYDLPANIANYLVAEGFAIFEQRKENNTHPPAGDRSSED